jgi:hypothetical protein
MNNETIKNCSIKGKERVRKSNRGGEFDQRKLYACVKISKREGTLEHWLDPESEGREEGRRSTESL